MFSKIHCQFSDQIPIVKKGINVEKRQGTREEIHLQPPPQLTYYYTDDLDFLAGYLQVCDLQQMRIGCPTGHVIVIESASYGRWSRVACGVSDKTACGASLLRPIQESCFGKQACTFDVRPSMVKPEPCPGTNKYLNVTYECVTGKYVSCTRMFVAFVSTHATKICANYCKSMRDILFYVLICFLI